MRAFDSRNSWLDNSGLPLAGRISFCRLHTTEPESIYDAAGTELPNPIFTNTVGQPVQQVFLKDNADYTVRFEKYVGVADMTEDQENWLFQYSCDLPWLTASISVASDFYQLVDTVADLRNISPESVQVRSGKKLVALAGYNSPGDKPIVLYVWNASSVVSDDGGSVIKVTDIATGRWELVNDFGSDGIDVRHFGVFGAPGRTEATDTMSLRIGVANDYSVDTGIPLYFPAIDGLTWYKMNNLNIAGAKFARYTRVFGNTGTTSSITVYDPDSYLEVLSNSDYNATWNIRGNTVKTSWGFYSSKVYFEPDLKLVVDSTLTTTHRSFQNLIVECVVNVSDVQFTNCQIESNGKLGNDIVFHGCRLTEAMFQANANLGTVSVYSDDTFDLADWPTVSKWLQLRTQLADTRIDFQGRTVDVSCVVNWPSEATYVNAVFDSYSAKQVLVNLDGCSGTLDLQSTVGSLDITGSNIVLTGKDSFTYVKLTDTKVDFSGRDIQFNALNMTRSSTEENAAITYTANSFYANGSTVSVNLTAYDCQAIKSRLFNIDTQHPVLTDCDLFGTITQHVTLDQTNIDFEITGCTFHSGNGHAVSGAWNLMKVIGKWCNNVSLLPNHFITLDRTHLDPDEQAHSYIYENNSGPAVLQKLSANWKDEIIIPPVEDTTIGSKQLNKIYRIGSESTLPVRYGFVGSAPSGVTDIGLYVSEFSMFTVGTTNIPNMVLHALPPQHITSSMYSQLPPFTVFPHRLPGAVSLGCPVDTVEGIAPEGAAGIKFYTGYRWRVTCAPDMFELAIDVRGTDVDRWYIRMPISYRISQF